jgi:hypothetical protein
MELCLATSLSTNSRRRAATNPALRIARRGNMLESSTEFKRGLPVDNLLGQASSFSLLIAPLRNMACKLKHSRQEGVSEKGEYRGVYGDICNTKSGTGIQNRATKGS